MKEITAFINKSRVKAGRGWYVCHIRRIPNEIEDHSGFQMTTVSKTRAVPLVLRKLGSDPDR